MRNVNSSHDFIDSGSQYYYLWTPSKLEEFTISVEQKDVVFSNQHVKAREAILTATSEEFVFYYVDSKDVKTWKSRFNLWKTFYHPFHVGIHYSFKDGNNIIFVQDKKPIALLELLKCFSKKTEFEHMFLAPKQKGLIGNVLKKYNESLIKKIAHSIFSYLTYLHTQGVVYGNLTLENVVVSKDKTFCLTSSLSSKKKNSYLFQIFLTE